MTPSTTGLTILSSTRASLIHARLSGASHAGRTSVTASVSADSANHPTAYEPPRQTTTTPTIANTATNSVPNERLEGGGGGSTRASVGIPEHAFYRGGPGHPGRIAGAFATRACPVRYHSALPPARHPTWMNDTTP